MEEVIKQIIHFSYQNHQKILTICLIKSKIYFLTKNKAKKSVILSNFMVLLTIIYFYAKILYLILLNL